MKTGFRRFFRTGDEKRIRSPSQSGRSLRALALALFGLVPPLAAAPGLAGEVRDFPIRSEALGRTEAVRVYVPDGAPPEGGWPVLYLLHGLGGNERDWEQAGGVKASLDRLIARKTIRPLVVVMPDGDNSWYQDSASVGGPGNYRTMLVRDLPDAVEAAFPVSRKSEFRAIAGLSMGGYGALSIGFENPLRYRSIAALSPAIWQNVPKSDFGKSAEELAKLRANNYFRRIDDATVTIDIDRPPEGQHFGGAFGNPFNPQRFNDANVFTHLAKAVEAGHALPATYLTVGDDDSRGLWRGAIALFATMEAEARAVEFRVTDGDHEWKVWGSSIVEALGFIDSRWPKAPVAQENVAVREAEAVRSAPASAAPARPTVR